MSNTVEKSAVDGGNDLPLAYTRPVYRQCASCGAPIAVSQSASCEEDTRAALWSDGYLDAPAVAEVPTLGKCRHCGAIGFLAELPLMEQVGDLELKTDYSCLPATSADFAALIENLNEISQPFHLYVRIGFWQLSNHRRRAKERDEPLSELERANLCELLLLLGDNDPELLIKAEIHRQLQQFEEAETLLAEPFDEQLGPVVQRLRGLLDDRNASVVKIFSGEPGDEVPEFLRP